GRDPCEDVVVQGVVLGSVEIDVVSTPGFEGEVPNLHSLNDAAGAGTDGYKGRRTEGSCSDDSGFSSGDNGPSGPTCIIDLHLVRALEVDGALDVERAAHWILPWFDDDHGAAQRRGKSERVADVVKRESPAPVTTRFRVVIDVNDTLP